MMSAPRIRPLAMAISVSKPGHQFGEDALGDHRGRVLGCLRAVVQRLLVDAERVGLVRRLVERLVGRRR